MVIMFIVMIGITIRPAGIYSELDPPRLPISTSIAGGQFCQPPRPSTPEHSYLEAL